MRERFETYFINLCIYRSHLLLLELIKSQGICEKEIDFYHFPKIYLRAKRSSGAPRRALSSVGKCKSNPLLWRTGCKRKGYDLIVYDKWTKRGDQLAKVLQRTRGNEKEK